MTIWILALLLVLSLAALGYRQGAIRVGISLIGIFSGVLLAVPLGKPVVFLLKAFGMVNPMLLWLVPPVVAFILISAIFKGIALAVHHKVEMHYKYKAGDLKLSLWERLNHRVGLCLGVVNDSRTGDDGFALDRGGELCAAFSPSTRALRNRSPL